GVHFGHRSSAHKDLIDMVCKTRGEGFGREVKRRIMLGTYALSSGYIDAYYLKALKVRRLIKNDFDRAFAACDVVLGPTSPSAAFKIGERVDDPLAMYLSDIYTISANLAGIPGISIPCGFTKSRLPIGLQLLGPAYAEEKLLRIARQYERETDWHRQHPPLAG
ncbi:MAG: amidase, partial [Planctomycetota bacterium]